MKFLFPLIVFLFACHTKPTQVKGDPDDSTRGSGKTFRVAEDSMSAQHRGQKDDESPAGELTNLFNEYVKRYATPVSLDSVFTLGGETFHLHVKHYCLMDSALVVPGGYVYLYKLDSFVTHNFVSQVRLDKNGKTIYSGMVNKKDFEKFLEFPLRKYGALLSPQIHIGNGEIDLDYNISIPLTDVGVGVTVVMDRNGGVDYNNRR
jgi:hypothetical protein